MRDFNDVVREYVENHIGRFTGADVVAHCPSIGRSSVLSALKRLTEEGLVERHGTGRGTWYIYTGEDSRTDD